MIVPTDIEQEWRDLLADIQAIVPGTILAGGCLRDLDNGRRPKDLDFFMPTGGNTRGVTDMLRSRGYRQKNHFDNSGYRHADHTVADVSTFEHMTGREIGLVRLDASMPPAEWLSRFDFGICQIGFDGVNLMSTHAYAVDKANRIFTLCRSDTLEQFERSIRRFKRLEEKYVGWTLVIPERFKAIEAQWHGDVQASHVVDVLSAAA